MKEHLKVKHQIFLKQSIIYKSLSAIPKENSLITLEKGVWYPKALYEMKTRNIKHVPQPR